MDFRLTDCKHGEIYHVEVIKDGLLVFYEKPIEAPIEFIALNDGGKEILTR